jgi:uncharacterized protein
VVASAPGFTSANFPLTNTGTPASITATAGTPQSATVGTAYSVKMSAVVNDASNNPVAGVTVTFTAPSTGATGTFANGTHVKTAVTAANGVAVASVFTANTKAASYTVTATVSSLPPANFSLTNTAGAPASIAATAGTPQSTPAGTAFPVKMAAMVKDAFNNPVPNLTVTFTAPSSGATGTFANGTHVKTAVTAANGVATASVFTANNTKGSYQVQGTTGSLPAAIFSLTNQ